MGSSAEFSRDRAHRATLNLAGILAVSLALVVGCGQSEPTPIPSEAAAQPPAPTAPAPSTTATEEPPTATVAVSATPAPPTATVKSSPTAPPSTDTPAAPVQHTGPAPPPEPAVGDTWARPADNMVMVYVPGGSFLMGAGQGDPEARPEELPQHQVTLGGFWIDRTEVNNAQFVAYLNQYGNITEGGAQAVALDRGYCQIRHDDGAYSVGQAAHHPVVMVTWYGADAYCRSVGGRLPTEAEWEYAARGPEGHTYPWGDETPDCDRARYGDCPRAPAQTGSLPQGASWCGALDMAGNVWEWVADWFGAYSATPQKNPTGPVSGSYPVQRGGGWHSPRWEVRATFRQHDTPRTSYNG